ncbi:MAG: RHS repeat protein, partial [Gammaproteobacteria bacterium]|nr:RHS repeat protein [Gammaproteobacteria bacterium]
DGRAAFTIDGEGHVVGKVYDDNGYLSKTTVYDDLNLSHLSTVSDLHDLDEVNQAISQLLFDGVVSFSNDQVTQYVNSSLGLVLFEIDALNYVTQRSYDAVGNVVETTRYYDSIPGNTALTQQALNNASVLIASSVEDAKDITVYDAANRAVFTVDAMGYVSAYGYDDLGNNISSIRYAIPLALPESPTIADITTALAGQTLSSTSNNLTISVSTSADEEYALMDGVNDNVSVNTNSGLVEITNKVLTKVSDLSGNYLLEDFTIADDAQVITGSTFELTLGNQVGMPIAFVNNNTFALPSGLVTEIGSGDSLPSVSFVEETGYSIEGSDLILFANSEPTLIVATLYVLTEIQNDELEWEWVWAEVDVNGAAFFPVDEEALPLTVITQAGYMVDVTGGGEVWNAVDGWDGQVNIFDGTVTLPDGKYLVDISIGDDDETTTSRIPFEIGVSTSDAYTLRWDADNEQLALNSSVSLEYYVANNSSVTFNAAVSVQKIQTNEGYRYEYFADLDAHQVGVNYNFVMKASLGGVEIRSVNGSFSTAVTGDIDTLQGTSDFILYGNIESPDPAVTAVPSAGTSLKGVIGLSELSSIDRIETRVLTLDGLEIGSAITHPYNQFIAHGRYDGRINLSSSALPDGQYNIEMSLYRTGEATPEVTTFYYETTSVVDQFQQLTWDRSAFDMAQGDYLEFGYRVDSETGSALEQVSIKVESDTYQVNFDEVLVSDTYYFELVHYNQAGREIVKVSDTFQGAPSSDSAKTSTVRRDVVSTGDASQGQFILGYLTGAEASIIDFVSVVVTKEGEAPQAAIDTYIDPAELLSGNFDGHINISNTNLVDGLYAIQVTINYVSGQQEVRSPFGYQIGELTNLENVSHYDLSALSVPPNVTVVARYINEVGVSVNAEVISAADTHLLQLPQLSEGNYQVIIEFRHNSSNGIMAEATGQLSVDNQGNADLSLRVLNGSDKTVYESQGSFTAFDNANRASFIVDQAGFVEEISYNNLSNVTRNERYFNAIDFNADYSYSNIESMVDALTASQKINNQYTDYQYDTAGRQEFTIDALGGREQYGLDSLGNRTQVIDKNGNAIIYRYDDNNRLVSSFKPTNVDAVGNSEFDDYYVVGGQFYLASREKAGLGLVTTYDYDAQGNLIAEKVYQNDQIDPLGGEATGGYFLTERSYTKLNQVDSLKSSEVRADQTSRVDSHVSYAYDSFGNVTSTSVVGDTRETRYSYDQLNRRTLEIVGYGSSTTATTSYQYDGHGNQIAIIDARGYELISSDSWWAREERKMMNAGWEFVAALTQANKDVILASYTREQEIDLIGRKVSETDTSGRLTVSVMDAFGNIIKATDYAGREGYFMVDQRGLLRYQIDANGLVTESVYDNNGSLKENIEYVNALVAGTYNERSTIADIEGAIVQDNSEMGDAYTRFDYDVLGRMLWIEDAAGRRQRFSYDSQGNQITQTDKRNNVTYQLYDASNRRIADRAPTVKTGATASQNVNWYTGYKFDARGNQVERGQLGQASSEYAYFDSVGRQLNVEQSTGNIIARDYDLSGNVLRETDGNNNVTTHVYNNLNQRIQTIDGSNIVHVMEYNSAGQLVSERTYDTESTASDSAFRETRYRLTKEGQVLVEQKVSMKLGEPEGSDQVNTEFMFFDDEQGIFSAEVVTQYEYDEFGNQIKTIDAAGDVAHYQYNEFGQRTLEVNSEGHVIALEYDVRGNVTKQTQFAKPLDFNLVSLDGNIKTSDVIALVEQRPGEVDANSLDRITLFTYNRMGRLAEKRVSSVSFGQIDKVTGVIGSISADLVTVYDYDDNDNLTFVTVVGMISGTTNRFGNEYVTEYQYDARNFMVREIKPEFEDYLGNNVSLQTRYVIDYDGNQARIQQVVGSALSTVVIKEQVYDYQAKQLMSQTGYLGDISYTHDDNGNVKVLTDNTNDRVISYEYDGLNRQILESTSEGTKEQRYNGHGEMIANGKNGTQEYFTYDSLGNLTRSNAGDGVHKAYLYDLDGNASLQMTSSGINIESLSIDQILAHGQTQNNQFNVQISQFDTTGQQTQTINTRIDKLIDLENVVDETSQFTYSGGSIVGLKSGTIKVTTELNAVTQRHGESRTLDQYRIDAIKAQWTALGGDTNVRIEYTTNFVNGGTESDYGKTGEFSGADNSFEWFDKVWHVDDPHKDDIKNMHFQYSVKMYIELSPGDWMLIVDESDGYFYDGQPDRGTHSRNDRKKSSSDTFEFHKALIISEQTTDTARLEFKVRVKGSSDEYQTIYAGQEGESRWVVGVHDLAGDTDYEYIYEAKNTIGRVTKRASGEFQLSGNDVNVISHNLSKIVKDESLSLNALIDNKSIFDGATRQVFGYNAFGDVVFNGDANAV